jgi:hypothetical protein
MAPLSRDSRVVLRGLDTAPINGPIRRFGRREELMAKPSDEQRRPLEALLRHPDGCAEAVLLADGFSIRLLSGLVIDGNATLQRKRVDVGGREQTVLWMEITEDGRKAITD